MWQRGTPWSLPLWRGSHHWPPEWKNCPVYLTPVNQPLQSQMRLYSPRSWPWWQGKDHQHPWLYPFVGWELWTTSSRGCWLAYKHTPRIQTGSHLLEVPGVACLPLASDRGGVISIPNLGHCTNILTGNPVQIIRPTWLLSMDWWALTKCNALYLAHKWLHHS